MDDLKLSKAELVDITGYKAPTKQLNVLRNRGFTRAYIGRDGVVLERAHYDAVCRGQFGAAIPPASAPRAANLSFFRKAQA